MGCCMRDCVNFVCRQVSGESVNSVWSGCERDELWLSSVPVHHHRQRDTSPVWGTISGSRGGNCPFQGCPVLVPLQTKSGGERCNSTAPRTTLFSRERRKSSPWVGFKPMTLCSLGKHSIYQLSYHGSSAGKGWK